MKWRILIVVNVVLQLLISMCAVCCTAAAVMLRCGTLRSACYVVVRAHVCVRVHVVQVCVCYLVVCVQCLVLKKDTSVMISKVD